MMTALTDPVIRLLSELVAINSINPTLVPGAPGEAEIATVVAAAMRRFGLDVETQLVAPGRPNTIGVLEGRRKGRALMLCGHVDTVGVAGMAAPFAPIERDGRVYGRGAQEIESGVAAMIDAALIVAESGGLESGRLIIAAVVDEEHSSIGADALVADRPRDRRRPQRLRLDRRRSPRQSGPWKPSGRRAGRDPADGPRAAAPREA